MSKDVGRKKALQLQQSSQEMGIGHALNLLSSNGDAIEKSACLDLESVSLMGHYAAIWANYVQPNRDPANPSQIVGPIKDFAERHYTALTRLLCACLAAKEIPRLCEQVLESRTPATEILAIQGALLSFFACAGAAVENLEKAFAAVPIKSREKLFVVGSDAVGSANWFYDRRTQYLHKRLVPVFPIRGVLHLDEATFVGKNVDWHDDTTDSADLTLIIPRLTATLIASLGEGWTRLYFRLRAVAPIIASDALVTVPMPSGSPRSAG